jgi:protein-disulfide isomerase
VNALKLATLGGVLVLLVISLSHARAIDRLRASADARLIGIEMRVAGVAGNVGEPGALLAPLAQAPQAAPPPQVADRNPTVSALTGVRPVGSKMPDADRIYDFDLSDSPAKGPADAPITLVEFSDFQCSFCRRAQPTLARVEEVYGDRIRRVWKHLPLSMHTDAPMAHLASVAVARQGKFWEFQRTLYADPGKLKPDDLRQHAFELGLEMQRFEEDWADTGILEVVEADMAEAVSIDLTATPGFFINGRYLRGNKPFEDFAEVINDELEKLGLPVPEEARIQNAEAGG